MKVKLNDVAKQVDVPFPAGLDSTMMSAFKSCPRKFFNEYMLHKAPTAKSIHLVAGAALAKGCEDARIAFYEHGLDQESAVFEGQKGLIDEWYGEWGEYEPPTEHAKSLDRLCEALDEYFIQYPMATDLVQPYKDSRGRTGVEMNFALPIGVDHPVTGEPLLYTGRYDMLGVYNNQLWAVDEKTTTSLGATWAQQWHLRSQFTGYCWAAREYGLNIAGAIARGICFLKRDIKFAESISPRADWQIDQWLHQVRRDIRRMIQCWEEKEWDYNLGDSCNSYGGCIFREVCTSPNPGRWLEANYEERIWNPLDKVKISEGMN